VTPGSIDVDIPDSVPVVYGPRFAMLHKATKESMDQILDDILDYEGVRMSKADFNKRFPFAVALNQLLQSDGQRLKFDSALKNAQSLPKLWQKLLSPSGILVLSRPARERLLHRSHIEIRRRQLETLNSLRKASPMTKQGIREIMRMSDDAEDFVDEVQRKHKPTQVMSGDDVDSQDGLVQIRTMTVEQLTNILYGIKLAEAHHQELKARYVPFFAALKKEIQDDSPVFPRHHLIRGSSLLPAQWQLLLSPQAYVQYTPVVRRHLLIHSREEILRREKAAQKALLAKRKKADQDDDD
jgi:hypothetical protein